MTYTPRNARDRSITQLAKTSFRRNRRSHSCSVFYKIILTTSAVRSTKLRSILTFASFVLHRSLALYDMRHFGDALRVHPVYGGGLRRLVTNSAVAAFNAIKSFFFSLPLIVLIALL